MLDTSCAPLSVLVYNKEGVVMDSKSIISLSTQQSLQKCPQMELLLKCLSLKAVITSPAARP